MKMIKSRELECLFLRLVYANLPHQGLRQFYCGAEKFYWCSMFYMHPFENMPAFLLHTVNSVTFNETFSVTFQMFFYIQ